MTVAGAKVERCTMFRHIALQKGANRFPDLAYLLQFAFIEAMAVDLAF